MPSPYRGSTATLAHKLKILKQERDELDASIRATAALLKQLRASQRQDPKRRRLRWWYLLVAAGAVSCSLVLGAWLVMPCLCLGGSRLETSRTRAQTIRSGATLYLALHAREPTPEPCPTVKELILEHYLWESADNRDGWGRDLEIRCSDGDVTIHSGGRNWSE